MRSLRGARTAFDATQFEQLKAAVNNGASYPTSLGLRSVIWKEALLFQDIKRSGWSLRLTESRDAYETVRTHFLRAIQHPEELGSASDPLANSTESPWDALRHDETIRAEIFQDVDRCMPENVYFRQPATQTILLDILFIFCKLNPDVGYRQGMHELLAPVVWAVERDAIVAADFKGEAGSVEEGDALIKLLDSRYIEHDAFTLFCLIMQSAKSFYEPGRKPSFSIQDTKSATPNVPILRRIDRIYKQFLVRADPELSAHLVDLEIVPQVFLMRWIRLLFGREYDFDETMELWDMLLTTDPRLDLIDYICVAMLIRIRWQLLESDANQALMLLLRYKNPNSEAPPYTFVQDALTLQQSLDTSTAADLTEHRTGRRPAVLQQSGRPSTPIRTNRPAAISPSHFPSGISTTALGFEALLTDAARAAYTRGEKWGLNRAVRDAVGEVRKNVSSLAVSGRSTGQHETAELLKRCEMLEQRNKSLASMLGKALGELWECQGRIAASSGPERRKDEASTAQTESSHVDPVDHADSDLVGALSIAIAKVQFVQVYLGDEAMPLPTEEGDLNPDTKDETQGPQDAPVVGSLLDSHADKIDSAPKAEEHASKTAIRADSVSDAAVAPSQRSRTVNSEVAGPEAQAERRKPNAALEMSGNDDTKDVEVEHERLQLDPRDENPPRLIQPIIAGTASSQGLPDTTGSSRPSLEQSSFSWMLGQDGKNRHQAFAAALSSPFGNDDMSAGQRRNADKNKAFLFGEDESEATPTQQASPSSQDGSAHGNRPKKKSLLKKIPLRPGSGAATHRSGDGMVKQPSNQDIDLSTFK